MEFEVLKEAIAKILQVYETEIEEDSTFFGDLCADSIDMVQILKYVEEKLDIRIDDADLEQVVTVKDAAELIKAIKEKP
ncbi:MAG: acyl carrier protein [Lachnospiraceae bacterium]|nr:acyl carrier protein [Lachnospiraceae bacterium]